VIAFRLKCKKYVHADGREYLVSHMVVNRNGSASVFFMSDELTDCVLISIDDYNALPYHWFEDVGPAPKGTAVKPIAV